MAIAPRCSTAGTGAGSVSPALTGWTNAGAGVSGTAPQVGDLVLFIASTNTNATSFSQTAGTGSFAFQATGDQNPGSLALVTCVAWRRFDGTETAPTFTPSGGARQAWSMVAVTPDTFGTLGIDAWATANLDGTAATTHTPNAATAAAAGECSLILGAAENSANSTTAVSFTAPTSWTELSTGSSAGTSSTKSYGAGIAYRQSVGSGSVAPGAWTIQGSTTTVANVYQVLVREIVVYPPRVVSQAVNRAATY